MGILDSIEGMANQQMEGQPGGDSEQGRVAGGMVQAIQEHPGGLQGMLDTLRENGLGEHVQGWSNRQSTTATPEQVQQGLGGTGFIDRVAEKAGVSPQVAQMAMTTLLPLVVAHFAPNGQAAPQGQVSGLAGQLLSRFL